LCDQYVYSRDFHGVFFFSSRRRHTRLVSDWSSDVCSSDLQHDALARRDLEVDVAQHVEILEPLVDARKPRRRRARPIRVLSLKQIGRASCRERGEMWVGAGSLRKKREEREAGEEYGAEDKK